MPGLCLMEASRETWPPVTPSEWISRRSSRARRRSTGLSRPAIVIGSLTTRIINLVNDSSKSPATVGYERHPLAGLRDAFGVQRVRADHHVDVRLRPVDAVPLGPDRHGAGLCEARAEGHVGGGVLVEQAVVIDAPGLADARARVDESDLAEPVGVRRDGEIPGEPVAVCLALRLQAHEAPAPELPGQPLDHAPAKAPRPRASERALRRGR